MEAEIEIDLSISAYPLTSQAFIPSKQVLSEQVEDRFQVIVSLPRLPASHKRCKVAWFGDAGGSETIETIPNIILIRIIPTTTWKTPSVNRNYFNSWNYLSSIGSGITLICWLYLQLARLLGTRAR